jgi:hypothetical protein
MLKVNYGKIFNLVDFEKSDNTLNNANEAVPATSDRIYKDLKRSDVDSSAALNSKQALI